MAYAELRRSLSIERTWAHLETITGTIPSRIAGSDQARAMAEYAHQEQLAVGLDSRMETFPGLVSFPEPAHLRVLGSRAREIDAFTLAQSQSAAIEGELIDLGAAGWADYEGRDVAGRIVLAQLPYAPARHEKALIAWRRGAAGLITANWGDEECEAIAFGSIKSPWGNPTPDALDRELPHLPAASISRREGLRLQAECAAGPVWVHLETTARNGWHPITMTSGEIDAGTNEFLLVGGHMDSWFGPQATDNAAGSAVILELVRVFHEAAQRGELRRGMVTGFWMGHETGTMISSARFADVHWDRLRRDCVGYLQIDQPGIAKTSVLQLHSTEDLRAWLTRVTREELGDYPIRWGRQSKNGDSSFFGVGLSCLAGLLSFTEAEIQRTALANLGWYHHSIHNTIEHVDRGQLALCMRLYARWMWDLLTEPVLPLEQEPVAESIRTRLLACRELGIAEIDLDSVQQRADVLHTQAARLDVLAASWRTNEDRSEQHEAAATILNRAMLDVSRCLVPLASTIVGQYGQDRYGHAWQRTPLPALTALSLLASLPPASEEYNTLWVDAVRARNRVADGLESATAVMERALDALG